MEESAEDVPCRVQSIDAPTCLRRPLAPEQRMLLWRFRWSLVGEPRALTKVLRCVDWADVRDARAASELIARWAPISIADALELLSPAFTNPEVQTDRQDIVQCC